MHGDDPDVAYTPNDYERFAEGDRDPRLKKTIRTLIFSTRDFIVYLDDDDYVEWVVTDRYVGWSDKTGEVLNRVSLLEAVPVSELRQEQVVAFRRLLGEAVARVLDNSNVRTAMDILNKAEEYVNAKNGEVSRRWYLTSAGVSGAVAIMFGLAIWIFRDRVAALAGPGFLNLSLGFAAGGVGALVWVIMRVGKSACDPAAGRKLHYMEAGARIIVGGIGGLLVTLGVMGRVFFPSVQGGELPLILLLGLVAGISERFVPNLVRNVELASLPGQGNDLEPR